MSRSITAFFVSGFFALSQVPSVAAELPDGYWGVDRTGPILEKTLRIGLAPSLDHLSAEERRALDELMAAGRLLHDLYEQQKHPQSIEARKALASLHASQPSEATQNLVTLYALAKGPVATTLDNERLPFLPVVAEVPGRNMYPADIERATLEGIAANAPQTGILNGLTLVREDTPANRRMDLATLDRHPVLDAMHPGLRDRLASRASAGPVYAVPYSVAYADTLVTVSEHLRNASELMQATDRDFAAYLRLRARDLLADDYEGGDASWVLGRFGNLNAQIGSYETYDDKLFGVKRFFSMSLLARDTERTAALNEALGDIQAIEDSLPYERHKRVRSDIPVGVYNVIADFGQARSGNTASILPNDADHSRKYGRIILLRYNIMTNPDRHEVRRARFMAAVEPEFHDDLTLEAGFQRTLWHEIGHYLGVDRTADDRDLDTALGAYSDLLEEMKADLASTHSARLLHESGYYSDDALRAVYAAGVLRVLQAIKPRPEQPYQTMQLMQWNYMLENGVLTFDESTGRMSIDYERFGDVATALLGEVLALQDGGDQTAVQKFVFRWAYWKEDLHGVVAASIRDALKYRFTLVTYAALEDS